MTCAELVKEAAKIIYMVHDEVKDKMFELELSWVGEFTNGVHQKVPDNVRVMCLFLPDYQESNFRFTRKPKSSQSQQWRRIATLMKIWVK